MDFDDTSLSDETLLQRLHFEPGLLRELHRVARRISFERWPHPTKERRDARGEWQSVPVGLMLRVGREHADSLLARVRELLVGRPYQSCFIADHIFRVEAEKGCIGVVRSPRWLRPVELSLQVATLDAPGRGRDVLAQLKHWRRSLKLGLVLADRHAVIAEIGRPPTDPEALLAQLQSVCPIDVQGLAEDSDYEAALRKGLEQGLLILRWHPGKLVDRALAGLAAGPSPPIGS